MTLELFGMKFLDLNAFLVCAAIALILGIPMALSYTVKNAQYSKGFLLTLFALPVSVMTVMMMVNINNQVGTSITIAGVFALVRFRSFPGTAKEIINVFMSMIVGVALSCAGENSYSLLVALIFALLSSGINLLFNLTSIGRSKKAEKTLRITIPESLDYTDVFNDLFEKYTVRHELSRVKTTNMGTMFQLTYDIVLKDEKEERAFLNELRCRNGNLDIICARTVEDEHGL
jgi:phage-related holin